MSDVQAPPQKPAEAIRPLTQREFDRISQLAYEKFGLELKREKHELVSARLGKKARAARCRSFQDYYDQVQEDRTGDALIELIDALTTNFTGFLREPGHFEFLIQELLPGWRGLDRVRIWSAACSTGEEPYTIAFFLLDALAGAARPLIRIAATDISSRALTEAKRGVYPADRLANLTPAWQRSFFLRGERNSEGLYRVKPEVAKLVDFHRLNLIEAFPKLDSFDVIFCRNVMIYFDKPTQQKLIERLADRLEPGGYLLIGHSENLTGIEHALTYVKPTVYRKALR